MGPAIEIFFQQPDVLRIAISTLAAFSLAESPLILDLQ